MLAVCLLSAVCLPQPLTRLCLEIGPDWYSTKLVSMKKYEFWSSQLFVYFQPFVYLNPQLGYA